VQAAGAGEIVRKFACIAVEKSILWKGVIDLTKQTPDD
jgi:hypothetical protein